MAKELQICQECRGKGCNACFGIGTLMVYTDDARLPTQKYPLGPARLLVLSDPPATVREIVEVRIKPQEPGGRLTYVTPGWTVMHSDDNETFTPASIGDSVRRYVKAEKHTGSIPTSGQVNSEADGTER